MFMYTFITALLLIGCGSGSKKYVVEDEVNDLSNLKIVSYELDNEYNGKSIYSFGYEKGDDDKIVIYTNFKNTLDLKKTFDELVGENKGLYDYDEFVNSYIAYGDLVKKMTGVTYQIEKNSSSEGLMQETIIVNFKEERIKLEVLSTIGLVPTDDASKFPPLDYYESMITEKTEITEHNK